MTCNYCDIIEGKKEAAKIYEDNDVFAFLSPNPATIGHIVLIPKKHVPIIEALSDDVVSHLFNVANKISIAAFESLKIEGTNIIVQNGIEAGQEAPHFSLNIIPRKTGDGLMFEWPTKQLSEEEMATIELQLKEELDTPQIIEETVTEEKIPAEPENNQESSAAESAEERPTDNLKEKEENYLIKQLKRMP